MEHRWGQRTSVDLIVSLRGLPGAIGVGRLRDVSTSGAFLQTNLDLPLLSQLYVELVGNSSPLACSCEGRAFVVRKAFGGVGIEWFAPGAATVRVRTRSIAARDFRGNTPIHGSGNQSSLNRYVQ